MSFGIASGYFSFASVEEDLSVGKVLQKMETEGRELIVN